MAAGLAVLALALAVLGPAANACTLTGFTVGGNQNNFPTPTFNADETYQRYAVPQVQEHFVDQPAPGFKRMLDTPFTCVDSRGDRQSQATPGGDLAEVVAAAMAYLKYKNRPVNPADVSLIYAFIYNRISSWRRPLFFHTDENRLRKLFILVGDETGVEPAIFPERAPGNAEVWLKYLARAEVQGCGHIRLMLTNDTSPAYSVRLSGAEITSCTDVSAADCISSKDVAEQIIIEYYRSWWFSPPGHFNRTRVAYTVELGTLVGKAVAVVSMSTNNGTCRGLSPTVYPQYGGSQLFVYHADAVAAWRRYVTSTALASLVPAADQDKFVGLWNSIAGQQLGATLTYLPPANNVGLFPVTVNVSPFIRPPGRGH